MRAEAKQRSFYKSGKLQLLLHADSSCTQTFRELEVPLAITHTAGTGLSNVTCLAVDGLSTALSTEGRLRLAYSPYGYAGDSPEQSVAFTGQRWDPISECYLLGAGRVPYSPVLMRRTVSDPFSPFGKGGINSYMYCNADPINYTDPSGRKRQWRWFGWVRKSKATKETKAPKLTREEMQQKIDDLQWQIKSMENSIQTEREIAERKLRQEKSDEYRRGFREESNRRNAEELRASTVNFRHGFRVGYGVAKGTIQMSAADVNKHLSAPATGSTDVPPEPSSGFNPTRILINKEIILDIDRASTDMSAVRQ